MRRLSVACLCCLTIAASAAPVRAAETTRYKFRDTSAFAILKDQGPCIETMVVVALSSSAVRDGTTSAESKMVAVYITRFDLCQGLQLQLASGDTNVMEYRIDASLQSASVRATVPVYDFETDTIYDVLVDVAWNAAGRPELDNFSDSFETPPLQVHTRFQGKYRPAQVTGSVRHGSTFYPLGSTTEGVIQRVLYGEVTITRVP